jgi:hypothetical protein
MLGNQADAFFTTPMPTTVTTQAARAAGAPEMPAPRPLNASATKQAVVAAPVTGFMPGIGGYVGAPAYQGTAGDMLPGMGALMDTVKKPWFLALAAGGILFLTKPGKALLRKLKIA